MSIITINDFKKGNIRYYALAYKAVDPRRGSRICAFCPLPLDNSLTIMVVKDNVEHEVHYAHVELLKKQGVDI